MPGKKMGSICLDTLEKRWRSTCRVIFKEEVGSLSEFVPWLKLYNEPIVQRKSSLSGKEVTYAISSYKENSKWVSFEEIDFGKRFAPVSLNDVKDIDSLVEALADRFYYTGNVILGNSGYVEKSSNISDSFYMYDTGKLTDSKYVAYSTLGRLDEDCFGCNGIGESQHCIKCHETFKDKRCFELWMGQYCSDCYYVHQLNNCSDCLFCFNLKNKRHAVGNLELGKEKYAAVKTKLLADLAETLKKEKRLPTLMDIVAKSKYEKPKFSLAASAPKKTDMAVIESAFGRTMQLLVGRQTGGKIDDYQAWLRRNVRKNEQCSSALSGKPVHRWDYASYFHLPKDRLITYEESQAFGEQVKMSESEASETTLANAHEKIGRIAFFTSEYVDGTNSNLIEVATSSDTVNAYRCSPIVYSKFCAYSFWPRSTEHAFGCGALLSSEFCINCYHSVKLRRCFEMDSCRDCSDSYFCHNCENVSDCMFCFNAKNLKYAIGNVEVGREKFMQVKKMVLEEIARRLEKERGIPQDIYSIGAGKK
ncbi:MAG: hypothetical protein QW568_01825 [Candidatus Anstonellaceae archaeon]